jgi:hypothetical protein
MAGPKIAGTSIPPRETDFLQTGNEGGGNSPPSKAGLWGWLNRDQRIESVHAHKMPCHTAGLRVISLWLCIRYFMGDE